MNASKLMSCHQTISNHIAMEAQVVKQFIKDELIPKYNNEISFTLDIGNNKYSSRSYIAITAHYWKNTNQIPSLSNITLCVADLNEELVEKAQIERKKNDLNW